MKNLLFFLVIFSLFVACSKEAHPIQYGEEQCSFCSMTIVDQSHAAQLVTSTGKNINFDSSECMIRYLEEHQNEEDMLYILSADYPNPGEMIDAQKAHFIISEHIPSPMGEFLSAIKDPEEAKTIQKKYNGKLYSWKEIKTSLK